MKEVVEKRAFVRGEPSSRLSVIVGNKVFCCEFLDTCVAFSSRCTGNLPQAAVKQAAFELLLTSSGYCGNIDHDTHTAARSLPTASLAEFSSITHTRLTIAAELHTVTTFAA